MTRDQEIDILRALAAIEARLEKIENAPSIVMTDTNLEIQSSVKGLHACLKELRESIYDFRMHLGDLVCKLNNQEHRLDHIESQGRILQGFASVIALVLMALGAAKLFSH
ncbi:MAG: hypothetical protein WCJ64_07150 [Rhodospirillaceae bacterium]